MLLKNKLINSNQRHDLDNLQIMVQEQLLTQSSADSQQASAIKPEITITNNKGGSSIYNPEQSSKILGPYESIPTKNKGPFARPEPYIIAKSRHNPDLLRQQRSVGEVARTHTANPNMQRMKRTSQDYLAHRGSTDMMKSRTCSPDIKATSSAS